MIVYIPVDSVTTVASAGSLTEMIVDRRLLANIKFRDDRGKIENSFDCSFY